jgi:hypothetical protein
MAYTYEEEFDVTINNEVEHSFTVYCDVEMTSPGYRGRGPSLSGPGEPPEPPEYEAGDAYGVHAGKIITFKKNTLEWLIGTSAAEKFFERALNAAAENWSD